MPIDILAQKQGPSLEKQASMLSRWTYEWITKLMQLGAKRPLEMEDIPPLDPENQAINIHEKFQHFWKLEKENANKTRTPGKMLLRALLFAFGGDFQRAGVYLILLNILTLGSPVVLLFLIRWLQDSQSGLIDGSDVTLPYCLAALLFFMQILASVFTNWNYEMSQRTGFRLRTSLTMALYNKSFHYSAAAKQHQSIGKILNVSITDTNRIDIACQFFHMLWGAPLLVVGATGLLVWVLGLSGNIFFN